eukprot:364514-Chlamydomonas_euryale.AAC.3
MPAPTAMPTSMPTASSGTAALSCTQLCSSTAYPAPHHPHFLNFPPQQMEDIQWYDRSELRAAVQLYQDNMDETMVSLQASFFVCSYLDLDLCLCVGRAMNWFGCIFGCFRGIWLATMPELAPGLCPIL